MTIVIFFKIIQVHHKKGYGILVSLGGADGDVERIVKVSVVIDTGELVEYGEFPVLVLFLCFGIVPAPFEGPGDFYPCPILVDRFDNPSYC